MVKVLVNVYDLHHANNYAYYVGFGIFHSGVEIDGKEYSFGGHEFSYTGVFDIPPRTAFGAKFRYFLPHQLLGEIEITPRELHRIIDQISEEFPGNSYHPLTRNCNTFSNELCMRLLKVGIPAYINRLANMGSTFSCIIPQSGLQLLGIVPPTALNDDSNDLSNIYAGEKKSGVNSPKGGGHSFSAFSGLGNSMGEEDDELPTTATISLSDDARRERAANAAYKRLATFSTSTSFTASSPDDMKVSQ